MIGISLNMQFAYGRSGWLFMQDKSSKPPSVQYTKYFIVLDGITNVTYIFLIIKPRRNLSECGTPSKPTGHTPMRLALRKVQ